MSLLNLRQLLMAQGAFCSTTNCVELTSHCQESIAFLTKVSRSLSLTLNSYLSRRLRLGRKYPVIVHAYRPSRRRMTLELQLQAKSSFSYSQFRIMIMRKNRIVDLLTSILVNMSLRSDLTFVAQIEKMLSFCKRMSKLNVYQKAESTKFS
jgi:hypothetical protein